MVLFMVQAYGALLSGSSGVRRCSAMNAKAPGRAIIPEVFPKPKGASMSYVITEKCLGERYATCVSVCPVDCIKPGDYQGEEFMIIDPDVCIDCGLCLPECPIGAIVETEDEDPEWA